MFPQLVIRLTSRISVLLVLALLLTGCASNFASAPLADGHLADSLTNAYSTISLDDIYAKGNRGKAERNIELSKLLTLSDLNYQEFRNKFYTGNADIQVGFDWVAIGLSTAGALTTGGAAPILSGVSAAVQGAQGKFNSRFFLEKTTETLVNGMDTLRATKKELIVKKMANLNLDQYSTEEGVRDILDYHEAGSLISALTQISAESGKAKQDAVEQLKATEDKLANIRDTTFIVDTASKILDKFWKPDGVTPDSQNQKRIRDWLDGNDLKNTPIQFLVTGAEFAAKRQQAIEDLNLANK